MVLLRLVSFLRYGHFLVLMEAILHFTMRACFLFVFGDCIVDTGADPNDFETSDVALSVMISIAPLSEVIHLKLIVNDLNLFERSYI